ncbi:MAG: hypothetical protein LJE61_09430 [Thiocapsa sp.]|jgi:hypothetical protein|nr:hypothetical protein [Thiocapsa sp.]MCG6897708.1 hypothetical protein [Thiocapsa sp.]MCG6985401.1 hypothetical protein [Thiocapsa sp.]
MEKAHEGHEIWVFMTLVVGFALSFLIAVVPHFDGAYRLEALMLAAWMIPYTVLSVIVWFLRGPVRLRALSAVVGIQLLTALLQRGLLGGPDGMLMYLVPLLTAVALVVLAPQILGRPTDGLLGPLLKRVVKRP